MSLVTFTDVTVGYPSAKVVEHLSFCVNQEDYLCVIGENGAGKSTLMKTFLGLIPPLSGKIHYGAQLRASDIGYLPQQSSISNDFPASCREIVMSGCLNRFGLHPFYHKAEKQMADKIMKRIGIFHLSQCCLRELSGGQQQRVLLARALCAAKKILLLDEPAAGLDSTAAAEMYTLIRQLHQSGIAVIMISHDLSAAISYSTHILHIGSRSFFWGTTSEYQSLTSSNSTFPLPLGGGY